MSTQPKRFLVTGGAGFIGSHLVDRLLEQGNAVTVLDDLSSGRRENVSSRATLVEGNVSDQSLLTNLLADADGCFHLAAVASVQRCNASWTGSHSVNLSSFVGLLECVAKRTGGVIPVVYMSSAAIYGDTVDLPVKENHLPRPISVYGADKAGCELHAHSAGRMAQIPTFGLRPFNVFGSRQHAESPYSGVISIFVNRLRTRQSITIFGDGKQTRDFIFVEDVVSFLIAAILKASPHAPICNVATGKETAINDVVQMLSALFGYVPEVIYLPARSGDIYRSVADTSRAVELLDVKAGVNMADGLKILIST